MRSCGDPACRDVDGWLRRGGEGPLTLSWQFVDGRHCADTGAATIVVNADTVGLRHAPGCARPRLATVLPRARPARAASRGSRPRRRLLTRRARADAAPPGPARGSRAAGERASLRDERSRAAPRRSSRVQTLSPQMKELCREAVLPSRLGAAGLNAAESVTCYSTEFAFAYPRLVLIVLDGARDVGQREGQCAPLGGERTPARARSGGTGRRDGNADS